MITPMKNLAVARWARVSVMALLVASAYGTADAARSKVSENRSQAIELLAQAQQFEEQGNAAAAWQKYEESIRLAPSAAAHYRLGMLMKKQGEKSGARAQFEQALALSPGYELARLELASLGGGAAKKSSRSAEAETSLASNEAGMNIENLSRENETLRSLARPGSLQVADAAIPEEKRGYSGMFRGLVPKAPQNPNAGRSVAVPRAAGAPASSQALKVPDTTGDSVMVENQSNPTVITRGGSQPGTRNEVIKESGRKQSRRGQDAGSLEDAMRSGSGAAPAGGVPASVPAPAEDGGAASEKPSGGASANKSASGGGSEQLVSTSASSAVVVPSTKANPSAAEINDAAFGEAAKAAKPGVRYGNERNISLGTYAFHMEKGSSYRNAGRWADAAVEFETALQAKPEDGDARASYAEALAKSGREDIAAQQFDRARSLAPNDSRVFFRQANFYRDQKKPDLAIGAYLEAIAMDGENKFARNNLGVVYMERGDYAKAADQFKAVIALDPKYDKAILNLGIIYDDHLNDDQQALKYYDMYLKTNGERSFEVRRWRDALTGGSN